MGSSTVLCSCIRRGSRPQQYMSAASANLKVWLNGTLIHEHERYARFGTDYTDFYPVTLQQGKNLLLVALSGDSGDMGFFGFEAGTEYTVSNYGVGYTFSKPTIHVGDTFTLDLSAENVSDLAGWQFDIAFDPGGA